MIVYHAMLVLTETKVPKKWLRRWFQFSRMRLAADFASWFRMIAYEFPPSKNLARLDKSFPPYPPFCFKFTLSTVHRLIHNMYIQEPV